MDFPFLKGIRSGGGVVREFRNDAANGRIRYRSSSTRISIVKNTARTGLKRCFRGADRRKIRGNRLREKTIRFALSMFVFGY